MSVCLVLVHMHIFEDIFVNLFYSLHEEIISEQLKQIQTKIYAYILLHGIEFLDYFGQRLIK